MGPDEDPRERIEALLVKSRTKASQMTAGGVEPLREAFACSRKTLSRSCGLVCSRMLARRNMLMGDREQALEFAQQAVDAAVAADSTPSRRTRGSH